MDWTPERELSLRFQIDTNRINARGGLVHMNRLEAWADDGLIEVLISEPAFKEVSAGQDVSRSRKGRAYIQSLTEAGTSEEASICAQLERIVFPQGAATESQRSDVEIVFNAHKYGARLVTADGASNRQPGGILGAAAALRALDITVLTDEQACLLVERGHVFQVLDQTVKKGYFPAILPVAAWLENWESAMGIAKPTDANPPRSHEGPLGWNHLSMFRLDGEGRGDTLATSVAIYQRFLRRHLRYANLFLFRLTNFEDVRRSYSLPRAFPENGRNPHVLDGAQRTLFLTMLCLPPHLTAALASWELRELSDQVAIDATKFDSRGRLLQAAAEKLWMIIVLLLVLLVLTAYSAFR